MKSVIITGSRGLIGSSVTEYFKNDFDVIEVDYVLGHDLTDEKFVIDFFKNHKSNYLINLFAFNDHVNIGDNRSTLFNISLDSFRRYLEINLVALFSVCREFARNNINSSVVNFSSSYGLVSPRPELYNNGEKHIGYSVSKGGVIQLTRHLAVHLAPNIRVNAIVPGGVLNNQPEEFINKYSGNTPMGRMMNKNELNGILEYLCSDKSSYTTGSIFVIDGGWTSI